MSDENILITERLKLREINEDDADFIVKLRSDPSVYKYFINPRKISTDEHLDWYYNSYVNDHNRVEWIAIHCGKRVGVFGARRKAESDMQVEVSYILSPEHYGKGLASEAIEAIISYCKDHWGSTEAIATIHSGNDRSISFIMNLAFVLESQTEEFETYIRKIS